MTLPASGPLSLTDIQTEFGGTNPIGMNEYYAGGGLVPPGTTGTYGAVPSSGALSIQNFYGTSNYIPVYIEELFSTWLYDGTGAAQTITNGINISGNGGLVWIKTRSNAYNHVLSDTARGATQWLNSASTDQSVFRSNYVTAFNTNGFNVGDSSDTSPNFNTVVSWTFREQPKFFDIVTYAGTGSPQNIAHNLGSVPGCIIVKSSDQASTWRVYHRSIGNTGALALNLTAATVTNTSYWNDTSPTATQFTVGDNSGTNAASTAYVAYLFAHDSGGFGLTGTDNVISCGSFTASGSGGDVNLGYEPQWVMIKRTDSTGSWRMLDIMRGYDNSDVDAVLLANSSSAETNSQVGTPFASGFTEFLSAGTYIYIAIRRGPMKVPTTGTSVFAPATRTGTGTTATVTSSISPIDMLFSTNTDRVASTVNSFWDRLRGGGVYLNSNSTNAEASNTSVSGFDVQNGVTMQGSLITNGNSYPYVNYNFKRAPGFFDEVCYTGTGANRTVAHNLTVAPEMMIVKTRSGANDWTVYANGVGNTKALFLNTTATPDTWDAYWNDTTPTSSVFTVGTGSNTNQSGVTYVAYLFATCPGVSKVGSFTGTGATQVINCGFTGGARFVLIKATSTTGDWYVWDSARGIVAGNDPYLRLNSTAAEVTTTDWVDTAATGFELSNSGGNLANSNGVSYIFLAIA